MNRGTCVHCGRLIFYELSADRAHVEAAGHEPPDCPTWIAWRQKHLPVSGGPVSIDVDTGVRTKHVGERAREVPS